MIIDIGSASFEWSNINAYTWRYLLETGNIDMFLNGPSFNSKF
jgi:hypothetical protein